MALEADASAQAAAAQYGVVRSLMWARISSNDLQQDDLQVMIPPLLSIHDICTSNTSACNDTAPSHMVFHIELQLAMINMFFLHMT